MECGSEVTGLEIEEVIIDNVKEIFCGKNYKSALCSKDVY